MTLEDFDLLRVIGKGSFGKVLLVKQKDIGQIYAMKVLNKQTIMERNEVEHTKSEKNILMKLKFPFLVGLHYSFQTPEKLYFIMDYVNGGTFHISFCFSPSSPVPPPSSSSTNLQVNCSSTFKKRRNSQRSAFAFIARRSPPVWSICTMLVSFIAI